MLLTIDIGNTHIVLGLMKKDQVIWSFRMTTQQARTSDEYGVTIIQMLHSNGIDVKDIEDVIVCSVVPNVMFSLKNSIIRYLGKMPYIVGEGLKVGIAIRTDNPRAVGADRIVNSVAAFNIYGGPCMAIDFGTSTTYDITNEKGEFIGGLITPGIGISAEVMSQRAAQLPVIEIKKPKSILDCKNTVASMQGGLVYGYIGQVEYIVKKAKEALGNNMTIISTGGLGRIIQSETDMIDLHDKYLTHKGLQIIYDKNKKEEL
ncbi:type III pantothenate kinase [Candidatus Epulonipiscium viviparus]|uniref:type III pantothenate kinase n=1 Tax=Candidatus Epulonipiscium viviparus TaxID=420336 RepID=UPI000497F848|nr:type III pantothenate kinase [Candidatus Epulopiscium viviparus]